MSSSLQQLIDTTGHSKVFFTSDTHFGSQRVIDMSKRPFGRINTKSAVEHMNTEMQRKVSEKLTEGDLLIHLGHLGEPYPFDYYDTLGIKQAVLRGNYDKDVELPDYVLVFEPAERVTINDITYYLQHEPMLNGSMALPTHGHFYLFGHVHKLNMVTRNGLNVGVDCHNFEPISMEEIEFYRKAVREVFDDYVFTQYCN
jgi:calcineurin-like phosphoesterase family protein